MPSTSGTRVRPSRRRIRSTATTHVLQWTSAFGWDGGYLYVASNRWHKAGLLAFSSSDELMYRVLRARVDMDSYMGPYRRGQRVGVAGSAPPRATTAACGAALRRARRSRRVAASDVSTVRHSEDSTGMKKETISS
ncbi:hypothetical protein FJT64_009121 [Amphibalanus amphitrite]|uniref:Uncharacterized protein n=1 Tax=Amphibalanus amphitrite TaxID=1232801 RepID=A0A6A4VMX6_AMPAM|nr:hypothetical protein FJT64_009121 [Amphibalanus amphitrite]